MSDNWQFDMLTVGRDENGSGINFCTITIGDEQRSLLGLASGVCQNPMCGQRHIVLEVFGVLLGADLGL